MIIRHAEYEDIPILAEIEAMSYPISEAASEQSIRNRVKSFPRCFWILEDNGQIVSFINGLATDLPDLTDDMYNHPELHNENGRWLMIFSVVSSPQFRRNGYATAVMNKVIEESKSCGRDGIVLTCKERLIGFYSMFGFVNEGVSQSVHGGALWYQMRLEF